MLFHEVRFPASLSFGSVGGPERRTEVVALANGFEERNTPWAHSRRRYDAGLGMRSLDDIEELIAFFEARMGEMYGFRWKDWSDFKSSVPSREIAFDDQVIAVGDGVQSRFQLTKSYRSGAQAYQRPIKKPVSGRVRVGQDNVEMQETIDYALDLSSGEITFFQAPARDVEITAGFEFDVPVRFDTSAIQVSVASFQAGQVPDVPVVEVRL